MTGGMRDGHIPNVRGRSIAQRKTFSISSAWSSSSDARCSNTATNSQWVTLPLKMRTSDLGIQRGRASTERRWEGSKAITGHPDTASSLHSTAKTALNEQTGNSARTETPASISESLGLPRRPGTSMSAENETTYLPKRPGTSMTICQPISVPGDEYMRPGTSMTMCPPISVPGRDENMRTGDFPPRPGSPMSGGRSKLGLSSQADENTRTGDFPPRPWPSMSVGGSRPSSAEPENEAGLVKSTGTRHDDNKDASGQQGGNTVAGHIAAVEDICRWLKPKKRYQGIIKGATSIVAEVNKWEMDANSYIGGRCNRKEAFESLACSEPPPHLPVMTARASTLLVRLVRRLPQSTPLREMLETLLLEQLDSIYSNWSAPYSLNEVTGSTFTDNLVPYYGIVALSKAREQEAEEKASSAENAKQEAELAALKLNHEFSAAKVRNMRLENEIENLKATCRSLKSELSEKSEEFEKFREHVKYALSDLADLHVNDQHMQADLRNCDRMLQQSRTRNKELEDQVTLQTNRLQEKARDLASAEIKLLKCESEVNEIVYMRNRLSQLETQAGHHGLDFARRITEEVFGRKLEDLYLPQEPRKRIMEKKLKQLDGQKVDSMKAVLDMVVSKFKTLPSKIRDLELDLKNARTELKEAWNLIPTWSAAAAEDLRDAFDKNAPVHHEIYSMKDQRSFAGLGMGSNVPPYLRAEGFVSHIFVSKGELETFMRNFHIYLASEDRNQPNLKLTPEMLHTELHAFMRKTMENESLIEFGYAFICGLEAYRHDPDFELFDLVLSGVVHPSILQNQHDMLTELQNVMRTCAGTGASDSNEKVDQHLLRAALQAVFPAKTPSYHNALRRALYETMRELWDMGKAPEPTSTYISDLFQSSADGEQTKFIEEVRRQHCREIIEFTRSMASRFRDASDLDGYMPASVFKKAYTECEPQISQVDLEKAFHIAFADDEDEDTVLPYTEVHRNLRHNMLLKPDSLWVRPSPKDVVGHMLLKGSGPEVTDPNSLSSGRRVRGIMVLDNPLDKLRSDKYSKPEELEQAVLASQNSEVDATGVGNV